MSLCLTPFRLPFTLFVPPIDSSFSLLFTFSSVPSSLSHLYRVSCLSSCSSVSLTRSSSLFLVICFVCRLRSSLYVPPRRNTDSIWAAWGKLTRDACSSAALLAILRIPSFSISRLQIQEPSRDLATCTATPIRLAIVRFCWNVTSEEFLYFISDLW